MTVDELIRATIRPTMESLGWTGRGPTWYLRRDGNTGIVNLQRSRDGGPDPKFTLNGAVLSGRLPNGTSRRPTVWDGHYQVRVGDLLHPQADRWWRESEIEGALPEIADLVRDRLVPDILAHLTDEQLRDSWLRRFAESKTTFWDLQLLRRLAADLGPPEILEPLDAAIEAGPAAANRRSEDLRS
jgi:hypothetical protein